MGKWMTSLIIDKTTIESGNVSKINGLIAVKLIAVFASMLGTGAPVSGALRVDAGADLQVNAETLTQIESAFHRVDEAIGRKDLEALMTIYSDQYRYQDVTKADMRAIWKGFFEHYDRLSALHSFSRVVVTPGKHPTAQITCTGALWATSNQNDERVNISSWTGEVHHLVYEHGAWRIVGHGRNALNRPELSQTPPPLF